MKQTRKLRRKERRWEGRRHPWLWQHGFLSESAEIYDFAKHGHGAYLSDYARFVHSPHIVPPKLRTILSNKLAFHDRLAAEGFSHLTAELLGVVSTGRFHPRPGVPADLLDLLDDGAGLVVKPIADGGGKGIRIVQRDALGHLYVNGRPVSTKQLRRSVLTSATCLVERRLVQHPYAAQIFPTTTNTIRFLVMQDVRAHDPFIAIAVHRIGTQRSYPVDNWSRGGLSAYIDLETGELGPGATFPKPPPITWHDHHPDTQAPLAKVTLPHWGAAVDAVLTMSRRLSYLPYIGWDLVITEQGPRVIEGNSYSDVNLLQVHRPLLLDKRVRRFYKHHKVI